MTDDKNTGQTSAEWLFRDVHIAHAIIENAIDGIIAIDANGIIRSVNPAAERLFGYRAEEMRGRNVSMLMPERHSSQHDHYIRRYLETGDRRIIGMGREVTARHRDGSPIEIQLSVTEGTAHGQRYFIGFTHDITARKRAEREQRLHLSHLAHATRLHAIDELASTLAHEIRQPLTAVHTTAQAALIQIDGGKDAAADLKEHLQQITQQARRASRILDQLRRFARHDDPEDLSDTHPSRMVEDVLLLLTHRMQSIGAEAHRNYNATECTIRVNRTQIEQVIFNLIDNALDAMREVDGPRLLTVATCVDSHSAVCGMTIQDTGPGIPEEHLSDLFSPYFTTKKRGMGLGLALCRSIVATHGGQLTAENRPVGGATFRLKLPIVVESGPDG